MKLQTKSWTQRALNEAEYTWMYNAIKEAVKCVENIKCRNNEYLNGEIYTHMRRSYTDDKNRIPEDSPIHSLFYGRKGFNLHFEQLKHPDKERLFAMFNKLRDEGAEQANDSGSGLYELENALAGMRASIINIKEVVNKSTKVKEGISEIDELLNEND